MGAFEEAGARRAPQAAGRFDGTQAEAGDGAQPWVGDAPIWLGEETEAHRAGASARRQPATFLQGDILADFWIGQAPVDFGAGALGSEACEVPPSDPLICAFSIIHC